MAVLTRSHSRPAQCVWRTSKWKTSWECCRANTLSTGSEYRRVFPRSCDYFKTLWTRLLVDYLCPTGVSGFSLWRASCVWCSPQVSGEVAGGALRLPNVQQTHSWPPWAAPQHRDSAGWTGVASKPATGQQKIGWGRGGTVLLLARSKAPTWSWINWGNLVTTCWKTKEDAVAKQPYPTWQHDTLWCLRDYLQPPTRHSTTLLSTSCSPPIFLSEVNGTTRKTNSFFPSDMDKCVLGSTDPLWAPLRASCHRRHWQKWILAMVKVTETPVPLSHAQLDPLCSASAAIASGHGDRRY